jgi:hypothetical protein
MWIGIIGISLIGLSLVVAIGALLRRRHPGATITHHSVRCPRHDYSATIAVYTRLGTRHRRRYADVLACSLFPRAQAPGPKRPISTADFPPYYTWEKVRGPGDVPSVPCSKRCLYALDMMTSCLPQPQHDSTGPVSGLELSTWPDIVWRRRL